MLFCLCEIFPAPPKLFQPKPPMTFKLINQIHNSQTSSHLTHLQVTCIYSHSLILKYFLNLTFRILVCFSSHVSGPSSSSFPRFSLFCFSSLLLFFSSSPSSLLVLLPLLLLLLLLLVFGGAGDPTQGHTRQAPYH